MAPLNDSVAWMDCVGLTSRFYLEFDTFAYHYFPDAAAEIDLNNDSEWRVNIMILSVSSSISPLFLSSLHFHPRRSRARSYAARTPIRCNPFSLARRASQPRPRLTPTAPTPTPMWRFSSSVSSSTVYPCTEQVRDPPGRAVMSQLTRFVRGLADSRTPLHCCCAPVDCAVREERRKTASIDSIGILCIRWRSKGRALQLLRLVI